MKRINDILVCGLLMTGLFLLNVAWPQAQARRLNQKQIKKLEQQTATTTSASETAAPQTNETTTPPNRPKPAQPNLQPGNIRLQAIVLDRFLPRLDLTEDQRTKIQIMRLQHVRRMRTLMEMERVHTRAYDEALFDLTLDQKEIEKRTTQLADIRTDMLNAQAKMFLDLRRILTPEQFTKLRQLMEEERALKRNAP
jgi:Spy/CpxP family protein refolding chaperone